MDTRLEYWSYIKQLQQVRTYVEVALEGRKLRVDSKYTVWMTMVDLAPSKQLLIYIRLETILRIIVQARV